MVRRHSRCSVLVVLLCALSAAAFAQQETATIAGTITDSTGAVVPRAVVVVTNVQTGITVRTTATEAGSLHRSQPSARRLLGGGREQGLSENGAHGRHPAGRAGRAHRRHAADRAASPKPSKWSPRRRCSTRRPRRAGRSSTRSKIVDLPLNGRDYNQLALLSPGVLPGTPRLASVNFKGVLNVNGNRTFNNVFLLDGVDNISYSNSFRGENVQLVQPSIEALQEFKIQTNAYSAEYGRSSGAVVNATIKSGTNTRARQRSTSSSATTRSTPTTSSRTRSARPSRSASATSSAARSADRSCRTGRSGSATTRGCAIRKAFRASGRCRRPPRRPGCSARRSSIRSRRAAPSSAERAGPVGDPARALGSGRRGHRRADSRIRTCRARRSTRRRRSPTRGRISSTCASITSSRRRMTLFGRYSFVDTLIRSARRRCRAWRKARSTTRSART